MGIFSDILLTVDYDRTLTAPDSTIPERNIEAIRYFIDNGGAFTVNTGRSLPMARAFIGKVPVNAPLLLYTGAVAYDVEQEKISFLHEIKLDMWKTVQELMELFPDLTVEVQALDKHYDFLPNPAWDAFSENNCAYATAESDVERFRRELSPYFEVIGREHQMMEMPLLGCSKSEGVAQLSRFTGIPKENCWAIGDGRNDVPMFRAAGHSVVMGDGDPFVFPEAEYITAGLDEGGVAQALRRYGLI